MMYFLEQQFHSDVLESESSACILLPNHQTIAQSEKPLPTLYLLHGMHGNHTDWVRRTRLEYYAMRYRIAIVMPSAMNSFYNDMAHGDRYYSYISEELPKIMEATFPLSKERGDRFVAGLSMGGYGALRIGLSLPDRYAAIASLSGPLMLEESFAPEVQSSPDFLRRMTDIFGSEEALRAGDGNLSNLARSIQKSPDQIPSIYLACGTEDWLCQSNDMFYDKFGEALAIQYTRDAGEHSWDYWDRHIERVLEWLPLEKASRP